MAKLASFIGISIYKFHLLVHLLLAAIFNIIVWRVDFILLFAINLVLVVSIWFNLPETNRNYPGVSWRRYLLLDYVSVIKNRHFLKYSIIGTLGLAGTISYQTVSSYLLQVRVGLSAKEFGYTSSVVIVLLIIGGVVKIIVEHRGVDRMIKFGSYLYYCG